MLIELLWPDDFRNKNNLSSYKNVEFVYATLGLITTLIGPLIGTLAYTFKVLHGFPHALFQNTTQIFTQISTWTFPPGHSGAECSKCGQKYCTNSNVPTKKAVIIIMFLRLLIPNSVLKMKSGVQIYKKIRKMRINLKSGRFGVFLYEFRNKNSKFKTANAKQRTDSHNK